MTGDDLSANDGEFLAAMDDLDRILARQQELASDMAVISGTFDRATGSRLVTECDRAAQEPREWFGRPEVLARQHDPAATVSPFVEMERDGIALMNSLVQVFEMAADGVRNARPINHGDTEPS